MDNTIRPRAVQRSEYLPNSPQEMFIVPLLKEKIEVALAKHATPARPGERVLDVGCGEQPFRNELEAYGYIYKGMDVNQNLESKIDFVCSIDEPVPEELIKCGPFQFILCTEVMEHVADWDAAFRNLYSLVAPEGKILITCPHFFQLHEEPFDFWRPTLHALRYFAERYELEISDQEAAGDAWDVIGTAVANCHPAPVSNRLEDRVRSRAVSVTCKWLFKLLSSHRLRRTVKMGGPLYLSNVVVLTRKGAGEAPRE